MGVSCSTNTQGGGLHKHMTVVLNKTACIFLSETTSWQDLPQMVTFLPTTFSFYSFSTFGAQGNKWLKSQAGRSQAGFLAVCTRPVAYPTFLSVCSFMTLFSSCEDTGHRILGRGSVGEYPAKQKDLPMPAGFSQVQPQGAHMPNCSENGKVWRLACSKLARSKCWPSGKSNGRRERWS